MQAMILSAGLGTRLRPVTNTWAKPAVEFLGVPLLYYPFILIDEIGARELVMNTHHKPEQIEHLARAVSGYKVALSHEPGAPLGSGGGIRHARKHLSGDFLVCNGDEVILPHEPGVMKRFLAAHRSAGALATILLMEHPLVGTQFGGVWTDSQGQVHGFGKDPSKFAPGLKGYHYIGLLLLNERVFDYMPEGESNIFYDVLTHAIAKGERVQACVSSFTWFETGNPRDFLHATSQAMDLLNQATPDAVCLRKICERFWAPGTRHEGRAIIAPSAEVAASTEGFLVASRDAQIEAGARVKDCVLLPGAQVRKGETRLGEIIA